MNRVTVTERPPSRLPHLLWAYPAALGAVFGSALATAPEPLLTWWWLALLVVPLAPLAPWAWHDPGSSWPRALLIVGVTFLVTGGRGLVWSQAADPWAERLGQTVTLSGRSDGARLWVPGLGSLLLRGEAVAPGSVTVRGQLLPLGVRRNPGGFDEAGFWRRRGVRTTVRVEALLAQAPPRGLLAVRSALQVGVTAGLRPRAAALQQAVTLGLRFELGELRGVFAAAGMAHLLALSGLHVGVLAAVVAWLVRPLGRHRGGGLVLLVVIGYVVLVGPGPSVVRAASMVAAVLLARALGVRAPPLPATLALAALACLLVAPAWVGDLGFQLSFLSVLGIAALAGPTLRWARQRPQDAGVPVRQRRRRRVVRALAAALATSAAAQAASVSVVAGGFGSLPLVAPLANVVAVPLASALVPLGALAGLAGLIDARLAQALNALTGPLAEALLVFAALTARAPAVPWGAVASEGHVLATCALVALALAVQRHIRWRSALLVALSAAGVAWSLPDPRGLPELVVLDVGQGDAVVLRLGGGAAVLIDGGGVTFGGVDMGARVVVPALRALGVWRLPLVVATHADLDHMGGLPAVLEAFAVGELWIGHAESERPVWKGLAEVARRRGVPVREVRRGESTVLGTLRLDVLHPAGEASGDGNADSVALLVRHRDVPWALLLGDVPAAVEADLPIPPTPVLLAPHHGSATSMSADLLRAARPSLALASVGQNRYGHPAAVVQDRLAHAGVPLLTTREHGALRVHPARVCAHTELSRPGAAVPGTC